MATSAAVPGSGDPEPARSELGRRGWRVKHRPYWLAIPVVAVLVALLLDQPGPRAHAGTPVRPSASTATQVGQTGLPTFGPPTAVEVNNPALNDIGDPYILPIAAGIDGDQVPGYAVYWTTDWASNIPTALSTDLIHWRRVADSLPKLPAWALVVRPPSFWSPPIPPGVSTLTWGPTVHAVPGGWELYYSTEDARTRTECVGAAFSTSPVGPFSDRSSAPLVCQAALGGDIDPSVVVPAPGKLALIWKNDGNSNGSPVSIWEQSLTPNGRSVVGRPVRIFGADQAWEHGIIEGPAMLADTHGGWWLFFSGGSWQSGTYATGVAWCATVQGPCQEVRAGPLIASTPTVVSPGGLDTFVDHEGRLWAAYSAFPSVPANARAAEASPRVLELARVLTH